MKVSVIVPLYNTLRYLPRAIESVLSQTWKDLELFLVDDGSTDGSGACCDRYGARDARITVIHRENAGQGAARNLALDRAAGDCILFLDSDDFLDADCIRALWALMRAHGADIAACGFRSVTADGRPLGRQRRKGPARSLSGLDAARMLLYQNGLDAMPWAKLYRASLWEGIRFAEDRLYEDLATTYRVFLGAKKVVYDATPRMTNCLRRNSDLRMAFCARKMMMLTTAGEIVAYADERCAAIGKAARSRAVATGFFLYLQMPKEKGRFPAEKKRCLEMIRKYRWGVIADPAARRKTRAGALLSCFGMRAVRVLFDLIKQKNILF